MFRTGWRLVPRPALAALFVIGGLVIGGLALAGIRASLSDAHAAAGFLSIAEDVPLMPGLAENADAAAVFDKPSGRIASTEAKGAVTAQAVRQFYAATLPQLGWTRQNSEEFRREKEQLRLGFVGRDGALTVRFELAPHQQ
jgi:glycine/D-amino acid oxidase-like deaminating enzyme